MFPCEFLSVKPENNFWKFKTKDQKVVVVVSPRVPKRGERVRIGTYLFIGSKAYFTLSQFNTPG